MQILMGLWYFLTAVVTFIYEIVVFIPRYVLVERHTTRSFFWGYRAQAQVHYCASDVNAAAVVARMQCLESSPPSVAAAAAANLKRGQTREQRPSLSTSSIGMYSDSGSLSASTRQDSLLQGRNGNPVESEAAAAAPAGSVSTPTSPPLSLSPLASPYFTRHQQYLRAEGGAGGGGGGDGAAGNNETQASSIFEVSLTLDTSATGCSLLDANNTSYQQGGEEENNRGNQHEVNKEEVEGNEKQQTLQMAEQHVLSGVFSNGGIPLWCSLESARGIKSHSCLHQSSPYDDEEEEEAGKEVVSVAAAATSPTHTTRTAAANNNDSNTKTNETSACWMQTSGAFSPNMHKLLRERGVVFCGLTTAKRIRLYSAINLLAAAASTKKNSSAARPFSFPAARGTTGYHHHHHHNGDHQNCGVFSPEEMVNAGESSSHTSSCGNAECSVDTVHYVEQHMSHATEQRLKTSSVKHGVTMIPGIVFSSGTTTNRMYLHAASNSSAPASPLSFSSPSSLSSADTSGSTVTTSSGGEDDYSFSQSGNGDASRLPSLVLSRSELREKLRARESLWVVLKLGCVEAEGSVAQWEAAKTAKELLGPGNGVAQPLGTYYTIRLAASAPSSDSSKRSNVNAAAAAAGGCFAHGTFASATKKMKEHVPRRGFAPPVYAVHARAQLLLSNMDPLWQITEAMLDGQQQLKKGCHVFGIAGGKEEEEGGDDDELRSAAAGNSLDRLRYLKKKISSQHAHLLFLPPPPPADASWINQFTYFLMTTLLALGRWVAARLMGIPDYIVPLRHVSALSGSGGGGANTASTRRHVCVRETCYEEQEEEKRVEEQQILRRQQQQQKQKQKQPTAQQAPPEASVMAEVEKTEYRRKTEEGVPVCGDPRVGREDDETGEASPQLTRTKGTTDQHHDLVSLPSPAAQTSGKTAAHGLILLEQPHSGEQSAEVSISPVNNTSSSSNSGSVPYAGETCGGTCPGGQGRKPTPRFSAVTSTTASASAYNSNSENKAVGAGATTATAEAASAKPLAATSISAASVTKVRTTSTTPMTEKHINGKDSEVPRSMPLPSQRRRPFTRCVSIQWLQDRPPDPTTLTPVVLLVMCPSIVQGGRLSNHTVRRIAVLCECLSSIGALRRANDKAQRAAEAAAQAGSPPFSSPLSSSSVAAAAVAEQLMDPLYAQWYAGVASADMMRRRRGGGAAGEGSGKSRGGAWVNVGHPIATEQPQRGRMMHTEKADSSLEGEEAEESWTVPMYMYDVERIVHHLRTTLGTAEVLVPASSTAENNMEREKIEKDSNEDEENVPRHKRFHRNIEGMAVTSDDTRGHKGLRRQRTLKASSIGSVGEDDLTLPYTSPCNMNSSNSSGNAHHQFQQRVSPPPLPRLTSLLEADSGSQCVNDGDLPSLLDVTAPPSIQPSKLPSMWHLDSDSGMPAAASMMMTSQSEGETGGIRAVNCRVSPLARQRSSASNAPTVAPPGHCKRSTLADRGTTSSSSSSSCETGGHHHASTTPFAASRSTKIEKLQRAVYVIGIGWSEAAGPFLEYSIAYSGASRLDGYVCIGHSLSSCLQLGRDGISGSTFLSRAAMAAATTADSSSLLPSSLGTGSGKGSKSGAALVESTSRGNPSAFEVLAASKINPSDSTYSSAAPLLFHSQLLSGLTRGSARLLLLITRLQLIAEGLRRERVREAREERSLRSPQYHHHHPFYAHSLTQSSSESPAESPRRHWRRHRHSDEIAVDRRDSGHGGGGGGPLAFLAESLAALHTVREAVNVQMRGLDGPTQWMVRQAASVTAAVEAAATAPATDSAMEVALVSSDNGAAAVTHDTEISRRDSQVDDEMNEADVGLISLTSSEIAGGGGGGGGWMHMAVPVANYFAGDDYCYPSPVSPSRCRFPTIATMTDWEAALCSQQHPQQQQDPELQQQQVSRIVMGASSSSTTQDDLSSRLMTPQGVRPLPMSRSSLALGYGGSPIMTNDALMKFPRRGSHLEVPRVPYANVTTDSLAQMAYDRSSSLRSIGAGGGGHLSLTGSTTSLWSLQYQQQQQQLTSPLALSYNVSPPHSTGHLFLTVGGAVVAASTNTDQSRLVGRDCQRRGSVVVTAPGLQIRKGTVLFEMAQGIHDFNEGTAVSPTKPRGEREGESAATRQEREKINPKWQCTTNAPSLEQQKEQQRRGDAYAPIDTLQCTRILSLEEQQQQQEHHHHSVMTSAHTRDGEKKNSSGSPAKKATATSAATTGRKDIVETVAAPHRTVTKRGGTTADHNSDSPAALQIELRVRTAQHASMIARIVAPTLFLHSRDDDIAPLWTIPASSLATNPNIFTVVSRRGGHGVFIEAVSNMCRDPELVLLPPPPVTIKTARVPLATSSSSSSFSTSASAPAGRRLAGEHNVGTTAQQAHGMQEWSLRIDGTTWMERLLVEFIASAVLVNSPRK